MACLRHLNVARGRKRSVPRRGHTLSEDVQTERAEALDDVVETLSGRHVGGHAVAEVSSMGEDLVDANAVQATVREKLRVSVRNDGDACEVTSVSTLSLCFTFMSLIDITRWTGSSVFWARSR